MRCYRPISAFRTPTGVVFSALSRHDILGPIEIPCGMCIGCRERRASEWATRVQHEAQLWPDNCFVTLTYEPGKCPANFSLEHRDFQLFMKRMRKRFAPSIIRFFMCGEYGPLNARPHYHACLFNVGFRSDRVLHCVSKSGFDCFTSAELSALWTWGLATVQDLVRETASYAARYVMKKALGQDAKTAYQNVDPDTGEIIQRRPEYCAMSLKPGIGAEWFAKYGGDVYPQDFVVADGSKHPTPKYYDKLMRRSKNVLMDSIEYRRELSARAALDDNTAERRAVKEQVHAAKMVTLTRGDL